MLKNRLIRFCEALDARLMLPLFGEPGNGTDASLVVVGLHRLYEEEELSEPEAGYRHERVTVRQFEEIVRGYAEAGYAFVTPRDLLAAALPANAGRMVMLTFDDGYADNLRALPVLERHRAKATVFVSPGPLIRREAFWWDAIHREEVRRGTPAALIHRMLRAARDLDSFGIRQLVADRYGADTLARNYAGDRPMTEAELAILAGSPLIEIGNHTFDHCALTACSPAERDWQVLEAQDTLERLTGSRPLSFSYPHGLWDATTGETLRHAGIRFCATVDYRTNRIGPGRLDHLSREGVFQVARVTLAGARPLGPQVAGSRARISSLRGIVRLTKLGRGCTTFRMPVGSRPVGVRGV